MPHAATPHPLAPPHTHLLYLLHRWHAPHGFVLAVLVVSLIVAFATMVASAVGLSNDKWADTVNKYTTFFVHSVACVK
jgi:hypothetical protein